MRLDIFQFIVPLTFLAIWALTSLLNRDAQPLPPRVGRPNGPPGPRPGGPGFSPRPPERRPEPMTRDPALRWQTPTTSDRPAARRPPGRPDDDIVIIEPDSRRPAPPPATRPGSGTAPRRTAKTRAVVAPPAKRQETKTPRALTASMTHDTPLQSGKQLVLSPLAHAQSPLSTQEAHEITRVSPEPAPPPSSPLAAGVDVKALLSSPAKLRESIILNELLQPPLALRRPRY